jgi:hypothetical protein
MQNGRFINYETAIKKLEKYCSIQERCRHDVIIKLKKLNFFKKNDQIINYLVSNNFIYEVYLFYYLILLFVLDLPLIVILSSY